MIDSLRLRGNTTWLVGSLMVLSLLLLSAPGFAQDQKFAVRFGLNLVEPTGDSDGGGLLQEFDTHGGVEGDFEWYFHPRVGFEAGIAGSGTFDFDSDSDTVDGTTFSTITVGINGHVVRSDKVDFFLGILAGSARYGNFEAEGSSVSFDSERDTIWGAQAAVDMTVSRKWAVNLGLKYLKTRLDLAGNASVDYDPVILRVMGVYRWGKQE